MAEPISDGKHSVVREQTTPFLVRAFVKIGGFHRPEAFEGGFPPTTDEVQVHIWRDTTLKELLTTLRLAKESPNEIRHPLAKIHFRALYPDAAARGRIATRDLGMVYSRDVLGEPGSLDAPAPHLLADVDQTEFDPQEKTLEELRLIPGDYLCVNVVLPKHSSGPDGAPRLPPSGPGNASGANGWGNPGNSNPPVMPRGNRHWRGGSDPVAAGRGRVARGGRDRDRIDRPRGEPDRAIDRRGPPPRRGRDRDSPPPRGTYGRGISRSRSRSPSRSPQRRRGRYD